MDRNGVLCCLIITIRVALRKESVDRNIFPPVDTSSVKGSLSARRAWIEITSSWRVSGRALSLSARRAWIEIRIYDMSAAWNRVALRKESVDRNLNAMQIVVVIMQSLSARRAWIEITVSIASNFEHAVALRKESVDRNMPSHWIISRTGGVALRKESVDRNYKERPGQKARPKSLSARRAWIEIFTRSTLAYVS